MKHGKKTTKFAKYQPWSANWCWTLLPGTLRCFNSVVGLKKVHSSAHVLNMIHIIDGMQGEFVLTMKMLHSKTSQLDAGVEKCSIGWCYTFCIFGAELKDFSFFSSFWRCLFHVIFPKSVLMMIKVESLNQYLWNATRILYFWQIKKKNVA